MIMLGSDQFSAKAHKLLLVGLLERCCRKAVVRQIPGITRCLIPPPDSKLDKTVSYFPFCLQGG
jgi:hypothetical protein